MPTRVAQTGFSGGEIGEALFGRSDLEKYQLSLSLCKNCLVTKYGGVMNRAGTEFIGEVRDSSQQTRIVGFQFSTTQAYVLEWGEAIMRPIMDQGQILETAKNITGGITQANPGVVTIAGHGWSNCSRLIGRRRQCCVLQLYQYFARPHARRHL